MKTLFITFLFSFLFQLALAQDYRNAKWGDNPETVKANETAVFISKEVIDRHLSSMSFFEFNEELTYTYIYLFRDNKLYGVRCKISNLNGENPQYVAINRFGEYHESYKKLYEDKIVHRVGSTDIKGFEINLADKKIYVNVKQESEGFVLYESVFKK
ncbi:MAG TPA: hypothetical protein VIK89_03405 [Cytophagaceae bacterium]